MQPPVFSYVFAPLIYSMVRLLTEIVGAYQDSDLLSDRFRAQYSDIDDTFDFIIVGAGSSGAVVSNRLATKGFKVLLLNAGGEQMPAQSVV